MARSAYAVLRFANTRRTILSVRLMEKSPWVGLFPAQDIWAVRERNGLLRRPSRPPVQLTVGPLHFSNLISSLDGKVLFAVSNSNRGELMRYDRKTQHLSPYPTGISAEGVNFSKDGVHSPMERSRPIPPKKIAPHMVWNRTVCFSMDRMSRSKDCRRSFSWAMKGGNVSNALRKSTLPR
jgi:hypothetical protein